MAGLRVAIVAHLFYENIALELLAALGRLSTPFDLFVTGPVAENARIRSALDRLRANTVLVPSANVGWDVGPFFETLPRLSEGHYDVFCKLHTKMGTSGYGTIWRQALVDGLVGSQSTVDWIIDVVRER